MKEALRIGDEAQVICQIESEDAVKDAEAIAAVPGVAGLFVGRADLALSMGLDSPREPRVLEATRHVLAVAKKAGKLIPSDPAGRAKWCAGVLQRWTAWN